MQKLKLRFQAKWLLVVTIMLALLTVSSVGLAYARYFGSSGSSGSSGPSGYYGRDGVDIEIHALGQNENFDLRGGDGGDGSRGSDGGDAYSCHQYNDAEDLEGAPGGDGGDGGMAGAGGDGGSVRVYFADKSNLKNIFIDSTPGRAGYPGEGSRGGYGCQCTERSWSRRVCHQEKYYRQVCTPSGCNPRDAGCSCKREEYWEEVCERRTFYCTDGRSGRDGTYGSRASEGSYGSLHLVPRLETLEPTVPSMDIPVENILSSIFTLTRHEWKTLSGAGQLFAPGSRLRNDYQLYSGKTIKTVSFNWLDNQRGIDYYRGSHIDLSLSGFPAQVNVSFPSELLALARNDTKFDHTTVNVQKTMKRSELVKLRVDEMYGSEESLTLVLIDDAKVSDVAATKIYIESGWDLEGGGEWKDWVPEHLITSEPGKISINIGRLPIKAKKIKKYFGDKCEFEMKVLREFAGASIQLTNGKYDTIDIEKEVKKAKPIQVKWED